MSSNQPAPGADRRSAAGAALLRYTALLADVPVARAAVARFAAAVKAAAATGSAWDWGRALAAWAVWRPNRLERRLTVPDPTAVARNLARYRAAASPAQAGGGRRWALLPRPGAAVADLPALLADAADDLDAIAAPSPAWLLDLLDRADHLSQAVAAAVADFPQAWVGCRLARAAAPLGDDWPPLPPPDPNADFLPLVAHLAGGLATDFPDGPHAAVFRAMSAEAAAELAALGGGRFDPGGDALDLFGRVFTARAAANSAPAWATALLRLGKVAVERAAPGFVPPLDPHTLALPAGYRPDPAAAELRYATSPAPARTVVGVDRFAAPPELPAVVVSLGPEPAAGFLVLGMAGAADLLPVGEPRDQLSAVRKQAEAALWAGDPPPAADAAAGWWQHWLTTPAGADWFHATAARGCDDAAVRRILAGVCGWAGVHCFPAVGPENGAVSWPATVPVLQPGTSLDVAAPPGTVVRVERFAKVPEAARFAVGTGSAAAARLWAAVRRAAGGGSVAATAAALDPVVRGAAVTPDAVRAALDELVKLEADARTVGAGERTAAVAEALGFARELAAEAGLVVVPAGWNFRCDDASAADVPVGVAVKPVFRTDVPAGQVYRVRAFGVVRGEEILYPAELVVSAGPAPAHFNELEALAVDAPGAGGASLRGAIQALRPAGAGRYLEPAAVDVFTTFWDQAYPGWATTNAAAADGFAVALAGSLRDTFQLEEVNPVGYRDHPEGWVLVPPGTRMKSGRVTRVIRPGLVLGDQLRVPARAEVE